jgi:DNA-binding transcriptional ArsR family regulator
MATERRTRVTDVRTLRGLAHPIRYRLLGHLMALGSQTASECAAAVGASPSNCSYHLRELERYGLVERVSTAAGADGRDRPWRPTATGIRYGPDDGDPAAAGESAASRQLIHAGIDLDADLAHAAVDAHDGQPEPWRAAETMATFGLLVSPSELATLTAAIDGILRPWIGLTREDPPADARPVHVVFDAFLRPGTGQPS